MSARHFQLAHHDPHDGLQHFHRLHRRMHLPRNLEQCLQAGNLLLQVNDVSVAAKGGGAWERRGRHSVAARFLWIQGLTDILQEVDTVYLWILKSRFPFNRSFPKR